MASPFDPYDEYDDGSKVGNAPGGGGTIVPPWLDDYRAILGDALTPNTPPQANTPPPTGSPLYPPGPAPIGRNGRPMIRDGRGGWLEDGDPIPMTSGGGDGRGAGGASSMFGNGQFAFLPYPDYESPGEFQFDPFSPSSWADAENEPGYRASREQLRKQVEAGAAHRGVLRSGMTLGDIYTNLDALGQQNFAQFDERRFRNYQGNRETAHMGYQSRATDFDRKNAYRFNVADASFKDSLARWQEQVRSLTSLARPVD